MAEKILCVDDEVNILLSLQRQLRKQFQMESALGPEQALAAIESDGPYAVVVSDLQMPNMNGLELLAKVRDMSPETVRIMLTGQADLDTAIAAVNQGNIFRFLTSPVQRRNWPLRSKQRWSSTVSLPPSGTCWRIRCTRASRCSPKC